MAEKDAVVKDGSDLDSLSTTGHGVEVWMLKWLQVHRQALVAGIQNVVPEILDFLVQRDHINPIQCLVYQQIMSDTTVPVMKARRLLDWLAASPTDVFWAFSRRCVRAVYCTELCDTCLSLRARFGSWEWLVEGMSLSDRLKLSGGWSAVLKTREELRSYYCSRNKLHLSMGFAKGKTMSMEQVNVHLLSEETAKRAFGPHSKAKSASCFDDDIGLSRPAFLFSEQLQDHTTLVSVDKIFQAKPGDETDKALAVGDAGCGKSVTVSRARCHANGHYVEFGRKSLFCFVSTCKTKVCGRQRHWVIFWSSQIWTWTWRNRRRFGCSSKRTQAKLSWCAMV